MGRLVSIGQAAKLTGVSVETLREWEKTGKISSQRTQGGHRRYDVDQFIEPMSRQTVPYASVSSHDQKEDLQRQMDVLMTYSQQQKWENIEPTFIKQLVKQLTISCLNQASINPTGIPIFSKTTVF